MLKTIRGLLARRLRLALTALAIGGVTFVTGTLVLGDTLNRTFDTLVGTPISTSASRSAARRDSGAPPQRPSTAAVTASRCRSRSPPRFATCRYHFSLGDRVLVLLPRAPGTFTITGIVTFGSADDLVGTTLAGFDQSTVQDLFSSRGRYESISVLAAAGMDNVRLQQAIARILPPGVEVVTGQVVANELYQAINNAVSFLSTALLIFALIAPFVGAFTIFNTFSITVGQRTRELPLLRVAGASQQVFGSVLGEAALTGLAASVIGLGLGVVAALGLSARTIIARISPAAANRGTEDRSIIRLADAPIFERIDRALDDKPGSQPRPHRYRRGDRRLGNTKRPQRPRMRSRPGLYLIPPVPADAFRELGQTE